MRQAFLVVWCAAASCAAELRVAPFRADATPALGAPLIWTTPAKVVKDPLWAKGIVLENGRERYVLCAIDWCGLGNRAHLIFRRKLAEAAGTDVARVTVHTVHQHTAPYVDSSAYDLLRTSGAPVTGFSDKELEEIAGRIASAARQSVAKLERFDRIGVSTARVERVASARRLHGPDGKIIVRYSTRGKQREMAEAPEGDIDPLLRTITLAHGTKPLVRLHYYATHPQTFCCEGTISSDIVGAAREAFEREDRVPQLYFTGAAGDVTVGKYNDESASAREQLTARLLDAFRRTARQPEFEPATKATWSAVPLQLPKKEPAGTLDAAVPADVRYRRAITAVFAGRTEPLEIAALRIGSVVIVHLPGEPMLAFQRDAQSLRPGNFVAFAAYGDIAPGYLCTDAAYGEGGYEPGASNTAPGTEAAIKAAIAKALQAVD